MNDTKIILTTDRLILRTWKARDIPLMAAISSDPLSKFIAFMKNHAAIIHRTD